jgi:acetyl-CoA carboxylase carboxyltransferase component
MSQANSRPIYPTLGEHIDRLVDPGSFVPAAHAGDPTVQAGDPAALVGGEALIDGRPVTVGQAGHIVARALARRHPYIGISSGTGGLARGGKRNLGVLDTVWGMSGGPMLAEMCDRQRGVPVVSAVVRHSFGDSTFFTGLSDYVVQLRGASMALTSPRVLAIGTSERVTMEELGGADVHRLNGQADTIAETLDDVYAAIRRFLSFLPSYAGAPLPVSEPAPPGAGDRAGPASRGRQLIESVCDRGSFFELRRDFAPGLVTGLARLDGVPVGVLASDTAPGESAASDPAAGESAPSDPAPSERAVGDGAFSADACLKATRLVCTCDAFGLPLIFLVDSPGPRNEPAAISRAMMLAQAVQLAEVPKCIVITRRAHGAGLLITGPARVATDLVVAWPDARAGYYDGEAGEQYQPPDGVIDPADTRGTLAAHLRAVLGPAPLTRPGRILRTWPVGFLGQSFVIAKTSVPFSGVQVFTIIPPQPVQASSRGFRYRGEHLRRAERRASNACAQGRQRVGHRVDDGGR